MSKKYKIYAKPQQGGSVLIFSVDEYEVKNGFVTFFDSVRNKIKNFAVSNVDIEEINNGGKK